MDEELWSEYDHQNGKEVMLRKTDEGQYELRMDWNIGGQALTWDMSTKALRDLFHAIQNEIGPCSCSIAMLREKGWIPKNGT